MIKKISVILMSFAIATSLFNLNNKSQAKTFDNEVEIQRDSLIQPMEMGSFIITASSATLYTSRSTTSYAIRTFPKGTVLWRIDYGPTYDSYGRAWYHVETYGGSASGWVLGSTGEID